MQMGYAERTHRVRDGLLELCYPFDLTLQVWKEMSDVDGGSPAKAESAELRRQKIDNP